MVDPTVFSRSVLCENESAGDNLLRSFIKAKRISDTDAAAVFADLRLFFRKWISEGFVGSLTTNGASLVWDYLFIHQFSRKAFVGVCLGLFNLLKPMLEAVGTYSEVHKLHMSKLRCFLEFLHLCVSFAHRQQLL